MFFMDQNDLDPRTIDLHLNVNLAIEILFQYEYVAQVERLHYGAITACIRKGSAFQFKIKSEQEQGFNGNDVTWSWVYFQNECIVPRLYAIYSIHREPSSISD